MQEIVAGIRLFLAATARTFSHLDLAREIMLFSNDKDGIERVKAATQS